MKRFILALSVACLGNMGQAQDGPALGCYTRSYTEAHLAETPAQGVAALRMWFFQEADNPYVLVEMAATMADQGQAARDGVAGQVLRQGLFCPKDDSGTCLVECDGGQLTILKQDAKSLTLRTSGLIIGDLEGCGGASNLAEVYGTATTYRLNAADPAACEDLQ